MHDQIDIHATLMWGLGGFTVFVFLLLLATLLWPRDEYVEFMENCRRQGLDFRERQAAFAIRLAFVRVRRLASELCVQRGGKIEVSDIAELVNDEAQGLHRIYDMETAKSFISWVNSCLESEILYEAARAVRLRYLRSQLEPVPPMTAQQLEDFYAATRVIRS